MRNEMLIPCGRVGAAVTAEGPLACMDADVTTKIGLVAEGTFATVRTRVTQANQPHRLLKHEIN